MESATRSGRPKGSSRQSRSVGLMGRAFTILIIRVFTSHWLGTDYMSCKLCTRLVSFYPLHNNIRAMCPTTPPFDKWSSERWSHRPTVKQLVSGVNGHNSNWVQSSSSAWPWLHKMGCGMKRIICLENSRAILGPPRCQVFSEHTVSFDSMRTCVFALWGVSEAWFLAQLMGLCRKRLGCQRKGDMLPRRKRCPHWPMAHGVCLLP